MPVVKAKHHIMFYNPALYMRKPENNMAMHYLQRNQTPWPKGGPAKDIIIYKDDWTGARISLTRRRRNIYINLMDKNCFWFLFTTL